MNNKLLLAVVVLVVIVGGVLLVSQQGQKQTTEQSSSTRPATTQNTQTQPSVTVTVTSAGFSPSTVTIKSGTRVIWINKSGGSVTVNSAGHPTHLLYPALNLGEFGNDSSVQLVFDKPDTYKYHDHLHPSNTGTVVVQ